MIEVYQTEEEQIAAIKKWWQENGLSTVATIAVVVAGIFGWQAWDKSEQAQIDTASSTYQNMVTITNSNNANITEEQKATVNHLADTLKNDFPASTYAQFAALYKAKFAVDNNDLDAAEAELRWILASGASDEIRLEVNLRLARVLVAKEDFTQALTLLSGESAGFAGAYEEVKADIYQLQGDLDGAIASYEQALELNIKAEKANNPMLEMKIQQLKSQRGSAAVNREK